MSTLVQDVQPGTGQSDPGDYDVKVFDVKVFYDGACPLCMREIRFLMRRDRQQRIQFVDIAAPSFEPSSVGLSFEALMDRIHGQLPDGTVIEGVEVFRRLYAAVGFRFLVGVSRLPGLAQLLNAGYAVFAKNRLRLTGRCQDGTCRAHSHPRQAGVIPS